MLTRDLTKQTDLIEHNKIVIIIMKSDSDKCVVAHFVNKKLCLTVGKPAQLHAGDILCCEHSSRVKRELHAV